MANNQAVQFNFIMADNFATTKILKRKKITTAIKVFINLLEIFNHILVIQ